MSANTSVTQLAVEDGIAVLTIDSPPVNALSAAVRDGGALPTRGTRGRRTYAEHLRAG